MRHKNTRTNVLKGKVKRKKAFFQYESSWFQNTAVKKQGFKPRWQHCKMPSLMKTIDVHCSSSSTDAM